MQLPFGPMPNIVILIETVQTAIVQDLGKKLEDMEEKWQETKDAMNNLKIATKEALRVRGDAARRIGEAEFWKQEYEKEMKEKERILGELANLKTEIIKLKEDKKVKNESILVNNTNLVKKLQEEQRSRITLINEILDDKSLLNHMKLNQRRRLLQDMRQDSVKEYEKLVDSTDMKHSARSKSFDSVKKASFV